MIKENECVTNRKFKRMVSDGVLYQHHTATEKGYISSKNEFILKEYKGRFGRGYAMHMPNKDGICTYNYGRTKSNNFHTIIYFLFK